MRRSYPERRPVDWRHPLTGCSRHRARSTSAQHTDDLSTCTGHDQQRTKTPVTVFCVAGTPAHTPPHVTHASHDHTPHVMRASYPSLGTHSTRTRHALGTHPARTRHAPGPPPTHTKRARTNRSGRATYSAQALGRLPWFAPCLRRSRRLRPRFDMSFSLGLLSRLKHFCTHWPKPPRHNTSPATKVTEKRAAAPASSARVTPRGRALSQRVQRQVTDTLVIEATTRARSASEACSVS